MPDPTHFIILYVQDTQSSAALYGRLLDASPLERSSGFALFAMAPGVMLGLWTATGVRPAATVPGGAEIAFPVASRAEVSTRCERWKGLGLTIIQEPVLLDFGFAFTAVDPDGHRLRVFAPTP